MEPFLYSGLSFATLHDLGNEEVDIERLQSYVNGSDRAFAPSLRNLPEILSMPAAFGFSLFKIFKTVLSSIFCKSKSDSIFKFL